MVLARVIGNIVSTKKIDSLIGHKLVIIRPINPHTKEESVGSERIVIDPINCQAHDEVLVIKEGGSSQMIVQNKANPVHSVIVARVEQININTNI